LNYSGEKMAQTTPSGINVAVITGAHSYDVIGLRDLFTSLPGINAYVQSLDDFASSSVDVRASYSCVVFYNFHQETPDDGNCAWYTGMHRTVLDELATSEQGVVFLHHGLLAYPEWTTWSDLIGIQKRSFTYQPDQKVNLTPTKVQHPITAGMETFSIIDEIYGMQEPTGEIVVLLTTDHPESMRSIAWVKEQVDKRTFCFVSGHDAQAWQNPDFQKILLRGICWAAKALEDCLC
jgi:hypothetical protein